MFSGDNGQGKTNLLEAIFVVASLRSFRTAKLADLVTFGRERARLGARVWKDDLVRVYEVELGHGTRKVMLDGKTARPLARYFGGFNVVVFTPEDLALPRASPSDRRRALRILRRARPVPRCADRLDRDDLVAHSASGESRNDVRSGL